MLSPTWPSWGFFFFFSLPLYNVTIQLTLLLLPEATQRKSGAFGLAFALATPLSGNFFPLILSQIPF